MCGLVGYFGRISTYQGGNLRSTLLSLSQVRGTDSIGAYLEDISGKFLYKSLVGLDPIAKEIDTHPVGAGFYLYEKLSGANNGSISKKKKGVVIYKSSRPDVFIGHTRKATDNLHDISIRDAHPFLLRKDKSFIGAHNGTLELSSILGLKSYSSDKIDSRILLEEMASSKISHVYKKVTGAMAVSIYDSRSNTLYLFRNEKRPLSYALIPNEKAPQYIIWASEGWMIEVAIQRHHLSTKEEPVIHTLEPNTLLTVKFDVTVSLDKKEMETPPKKTSIVYKKYWSDYDSLWGPFIESNTKSGGKTTLSALPAPSKPKVKDKDKTSAPDSFCNRDNITITKNGILVHPLDQLNISTIFSSVSALTARYPNCSLCNSTIDTDNLLDYIFTKDECICPDCILYMFDYYNEFAPTLTSLGKPFFNEMRRRKTVQGKRLFTLKMAEKKYAS